MFNSTAQPGNNFRWFRRANVVLLAVVCGLAGYVAVKYLTASIEEEPAAEENVRRERVPAVRDVTGFQAPPLSVYLAGIAQKNLFEPKVLPVLGENAVLSAGPPALQDKIKLIGILLDKDSKAIVEDLQGHQTHFLSRGDSIGAVLLEEIREDKVIFRYQNEQFEMSL